MNYLISYLAEYYKPSAELVLGEFTYEFMAWPNGFDNIKGTRDDIVIPYGEQIPSVNR